MEKKLNLLGIRKKVILCHTKSLAGVTYTVMRPITEEDEQNLDKFEYLDIDNKRIDKKDIYCYGEINLSSNDDVEYIKCRISFSYSFNKSITFLIIKITMNSSTIISIK